MVLVSFPIEVLDDAKLLPTLAPEVLNEFCMIAVEHIRVGVISKSKYSKAATALSVDVSALISAVEALSHMILECVRRGASGEDFSSSVSNGAGASEGSLSFTDAAIEVLRACYNVHSKDLRMLLDDLSLRLGHYHNLEWRLDVPLASRMLRSGGSLLQPLLIIELETKDARGNPTKNLMQMDYANLDHLVQQLEMAVKEVNTKHSRRVLRYVK